MCPFCVSSWDCDGPYIDPKDIHNYYERIWHIKEDVALLAVETIKQYADQHELDMSDLGNIIYNKIMSRSVN